MSLLSHHSMLFRSRLLSMPDVCCHVFAAGSADAALLIFTLAAVTPEEMPAMLHTAFQVGQCLCALQHPTSLSL